jgi:hypothetical protein
VLGLVVGLAAVGAALSAQVLHPVHDASRGHAGVADDVTTSFGVVAVDHAEVLGPTPPTGPADHGAHAGGHGGQIEVQATVTITNQTAAVLDYSPDQFHLRVGRGGSPVTASYSSVTAGTLQPNAHITGRLTFLVPQLGHLWIEFRDPGRRSPVLVDLAQGSGAPSSPSHHHG